MSGSMETAVLLSDAPENRATWKEIVQQEWELKAVNCPARIEFPMSERVECVVTSEPCQHGSCFGLYWWRN